MQKVSIKKMKQVGIIRPLDKLGRVVIPMEFRKIMGVGQSTLLEQRLCKDEAVRIYNSINNDIKN